MRQANSLKQIHFGSFVLLIKALRESAVARKITLFGKCVTLFVFSSVTHVPPFKLLRLSSLTLESVICLLTFIVGKSSHARSDGKMQRWVLVNLARLRDSPLLVVIFFPRTIGVCCQALKCYTVFFLKYLFVFSEAFSRRQSAQLSQTCNVFFNRLWACANDLWPTFGLCPARLKHGNTLRRSPSEAAVAHVSCDTSAGTAIFPPEIFCSTGGLE